MGDLKKKIEDLKAKARNASGEEKAAIMAELQSARKRLKEQNAQESMDGLREKNARSAEKSGDSPRAMRIRSSKQLQGVGEEGRNTYEEKGKIKSKKKYSQGGKVPKASSGMRIKKKNC